MKNILDSARTSLRFRMVLGMLVMLLPLLVLGIGSLLSTQRIAATLEDIARTERDGLKPVMDLQRLLLQAATPPSDYLVLGGEYERASFELFMHQVDETFAVLLAPHVFREPREKALADEAHAAWDAARTAGIALLMNSRALSSTSRGQHLKAFDDHIARASDALGRLYEEVRSEIEQQRMFAKVIERRTTTFMAVTFLGAVAIAIVAGWLLTRSIILPIRALQEGVVRFSRGDHSSRVALVDRGDEFGHLAQTLNTMASRLELDGLTGVYHRAEFDRRLTSEVERTQRYGHSLTLLMLDLDRLRHVNDLHGEQRGDEVLQIVTTRLAQELRAVDTVARFGGGKFAIIMPETGSSGARTVAERLRKAVAARPVITTAGDEVGITVSVGCATTPQDARSRDELIAAAEAALRAAKSAGPDHVVYYSPDLPPASSPVV